MNVLKFIIVGLMLCPLFTIRAMENPRNHKRNIIVKKPAQKPAFKKPAAPTVIHVKPAALYKTPAIFFMHKAKAKAQGHAHKPIKAPVVKPAAVAQVPVKPAAAGAYEEFSDDRDTDEEVDMDADIDIEQAVLLESLKMMRLQQQPKDAPRAEEKKKEVKDKKVIDSCPICYADFTAENLRTFSCDHSICTNCLLYTVDLAIKEKSSERLICPHAACVKERRKLDNEDIAYLDLDQERINKLHEIFVQQLIDKDAKLLKRCPTADCKNAFYVAPGKRFIMQCAGCEKQYCVECLTEHTDMKLSCEKWKELQEKLAKGTKANDEWVKKHTKPCPGCNRPIEKLDGCNRITCSKCNYNFCWICRSKYDMVQYKCPRGCSVY